MQLCEVVHFCQVVITKNPGNARILLVSFISSSLFQRYQLIVKFDH